MKLINYETAMYANKHLPQRDTHQSFAKKVKHFNKQDCCFAHREKRFGHFPVDDLKRSDGVYILFDGL